MAASPPVNSKIKFQAGLTESLSAIEALKTEVLEMQSVDFKKYADIIINLERPPSYIPAG